MPFWGTAWGNLSLCGRHRHSCSFYHRTAVYVDLVVNELNYLDLVVNCTKSNCIRFGRRHKAACCTIVIAYGTVIPWVTEIRYLGITIASASYFKCSFTHAKKSFCRAANAIIGKVGLLREDILVHLIKSKCLPVLLYATEVCPLSTSDLQSLDFVVMRFLMKIFRTANRLLVIECLSYFGVLMPSDLIPLRTSKFLTKLRACDQKLAYIYR